VSYVFVNYNKYYINYYNFIHDSENFLIITITLTIISHISGDCPKPEILNPWTCNKNNNIYCGESSSIGLKTIFHRMSTNLEKEKKHFKHFYLTNTEIKGLPEKAFEDITFDEIWINNATNLSLIHTIAFKGMNSILQKFLVSNTSLINSPPNYDIFLSISSMINITYTQISNSLIEEIP
jgi:hypothetical protein